MIETKSVLLFLVSREHTAMSDQPTDQERLIALEIRAAEAERTVADLSEMVTRQWAEIDRLKGMVTRLTDRMVAAENALPSGAPEPPPPHY